MAEEMTIYAGCATSFKGKVYGALIRHIRAKFLNGASIGIAKRAEVDFARKMLPQMKNKIESVPGLVAGLSNMAISIRDNYKNPVKSPWNFERYDSDLERRMMDCLEKDPFVVKWMKRHGITIKWIDGQKHQRRYVPDFFVEYEDGGKVILEIKDPSRLDSDDVKRKRIAAEIWCKKRGMEYRLMTVS